MSLPTYLITGVASAYGFCYGTVLSRNSGVSVSLSQTVKCALVGALPCALIALAYSSLVNEYERKSLRANHVIRLVDAVTLTIAMITWIGIRNLSWIPKHKKFYYNSIHWPISIFFIYYIPTMLNKIYCLEVKRKRDARLLEAANNVTKDVDTFIAEDIYSADLRYEYCKDKINSSLTTAIQEQMEPEFIQALQSILKCCEDCID